MTSQKPGKAVILRSNGVDPDPRVEKEARALHRAGWQVSIIGWDRTGQLCEHECRDYATLTLLRIPARFTSLPVKLMHMSRWQLALLMRLIRDRCNYSHIHACDLDTILPALFMKRIFGKKVIYDVFDIYADMLRDGPGAFRKLIRRVELWAIGRADAVILVDDCRREQIAGSKPKSLYVIYNTPEPMDLPASQPGNAEGLRIAYVGLLHIDRGILDMLNVLGNHPDWSMDLGGSGTDEEVILHTASGMPNVSVHGQIPYVQALKIYARADVLFATYDPSIPNHKYSSANKLFEAMMLGKPIIVARDTGMDKIVGKYKLGEVVDYGNTFQLEAALSNIAAMGSEDRQALSDRARAVYAHEFHWDRMQERLLNLYTSLNTH